MEICNRTFELAKTHLVGLDYHGPVALACDDTKLFAALWLFWNKKEGCYFLVSACGGPVRVSDVDAAREALENPEMRKATKVRKTLQVHWQIIKHIYSDPPMVYDNPCGWDCTDCPRRITDL